MSKKKALELIRILLYCCKEHILNIEIEPEKLKMKITDRLLSDGLQIKDMTEEESIDYLVANFYCS